MKNKDQIELEDKIEAIIRKHKWSSSMENLVMDIFTWHQKSAKAQTIKVIEKIEGMRRPDWEKVGHLCYNAGINSVIEALKEEEKL